MRRLLASLVVLAAASPVGAAYGSSVILGPADCIRIDVSLPPYAPEISICRIV